MASEPDREAEGAAPTEPRQARWRPGGPEPSAFMRLALRLLGPRRGRKCRSTAT